MASVEKLNSHTDKIACQTCHIPAYARGDKATKMTWDWSTAGTLDEEGHRIRTRGSDGNVIYDSKKGDFTYERYVIPEYPAVADHRLVGALLEAAEQRGIRHRAGITWSFDAFYARNAVLQPNGSMASMSVGGYWTREHAERIENMRSARVQNCEMESGVLLTLAGLFGVRAGCICVVSDLTPWPGPSHIDLDRNMGTCIEVAHAAMLSIAPK